MTDVMASVPAFEIKVFDKLPEGLERNRNGQTERSVYNWGDFPVKGFIEVPGDRYNAAHSAVMQFQSKHKHDPEQQKKIEQHMRGRILAAKKQAEKDGIEWTEKMEKEVQPDPKFIANHTRKFNSFAVKDSETGQPIKTKGYQGKKGVSLADTYIIVRTS